MHYTFCCDHKPNGISNGANNDSSIFYTGWHSCFSWSQRHFSVFIQYNSRFAASTQRWNLCCRKGQFSERGKEVRTMHVHSYTTVCTGNISLLKWFYYWSSNAWCNTSLGSLMHSPLACAWRDFDQYCIILMCTLKHLIKASKVSSKYYILHRSFSIICLNCMEHDPNITLWRMVVILLVCSVVYPCT